MCQILRILLVFDSVCPINGLNEDDPACVIRMMLRLCFFFLSANYGAELRQLY